SADCLIDTQKLAEGFERMATGIDREMAHLNPVVLCVMMGGLYATVEITRRLGFALEIDYLHATRYRGETSGGDLLWKARPGLSLSRRHVLVVDDILDEGRTLAAVLNEVRSQRPASVNLAVLLEKKHDRR